MCLGVRPRICKSKHLRCDARALSYYAIAYAPVRHTSKVDVENSAYFKYSCTLITETHMPSNHCPLNTYNSCCSWACKPLYKTNQRAWVNNIIITKSSVNIIVKRKTIYLHPTNLRRCRQTFPQRQRKLQQLNREFSHSDCWRKPRQTIYTALTKCHSGMQSSHYQQQICEDSNEESEGELISFEYM